MLSVKASFSVAFTSDPTLKLEPNPIGSDAPAPTTKRLQFHCLHCHSRLVVRPVKKTSKMACPNCSTRMYVDANGKVSINDPPEGRPSPPVASGTIVPNLDRRRKQREIDVVARSKSSGPGSESLAAPRSPEGTPGVNEAWSEQTPLGAGIPTRSEPSPPGPEMTGGHSAIGKSPVETGPLPQIESRLPAPPRNPEESSFDSDTLHRLLLSQVSRDHDDFQTSATAMEEPEIAPNAQSRPKKASRGSPFDEQAPRIHHLSSPGSSWRSMLTAALLSLALALPIALLGALVQPTVSSSAPAGERETLVVEKAGTILERGLGRLLDALDRRVSYSARSSDDALTPVTADVSIVPVSE